MRRTDRAVQDPAQEEEILRACDVLRLGLVDRGLAYVVPLCFGIVREHGVLTFYVHCADTGRKLDLLEANPRAAFEMDTDHVLRPGDAACGWSMGYRSAMGVASLRRVEDPEEKRRGLDAIMAHYTGKGSWPYPAAALDRVTVLALWVEEISYKRS